MPYFRKRIVAEVLACRARTRAQGVLAANWSALQRRFGKRRRSKRQVLLHVACSAARRYRPQAARTAPGRRAVPTARGCDQCDLRARVFVEAAPCPPAPAARRARLPAARAGSSSTQPQPRSARVPVHATLARPVCAPAGSAGDAPGTEQLGARASHVAVRSLKRRWSCCRLSSRRRRWVPSRWWASPACTQPSARTCARSCGHRCTGA
jgi:hypothetical protein